MRATSIEAQPAKMADQYSEQWFFDLQRELPFDILTTIGYQGNGTHHMLIVMDYDGRNLTGVVNPGANAIPIKLARLDITPGKPPAKPGEPVGEPTFKMHIEADTKDAKGNSISIVADGTMKQVGLPGRSMVGTWTQTSGGKTVKGDFRISRQ